MNNLQMIRKKAGLTQVELSCRCGWDTQSRISGYESGVRSPSVEDAGKIAKALNCSIDELVSITPKSE